MLLSRLESPTRIPTRHAARHKICYNIVLKKPDLYLLRNLPLGFVGKFELILCTYLQFLQRQKFAKLKKLRDAQRSLPIYAHRENILRAVAENDVTIVAGDTG